MFRAGKRSHGHHRHFSWGLYSLALKNDGTVWACGSNLFGELGDGTNTDTNVFVQVTGLCAVGVGMEEITTGASVTVFPNPTTGKFTVTGLDRSRTTSLEIRDVMGQEIDRSSIDGPSFEIDLSDRPAGIYMLSVRTPGRIVAQKVVKQ
jgi:hypothetical protein